jgi:hypothetical protein
MPCSLLYHPWIGGGNICLNWLRNWTINFLRVWVWLEFATRNLRHFSVVAWCTKHIVLGLVDLDVQNALGSQWIISIDHLLEIDEIGERSFLGSDAHPLLHEAVLSEFLLDWKDVDASHHLLFVVPTRFWKRWEKTVLEYWWSPFDWILLIMGVLIHFQVLFFLIIIKEK